MNFAGRHMQRPGVAAEYGRSPFPFAPFLPMYTSKYRRDYDFTVTRTRRVSSQGDALPSGWSTMRLWLCGRAGQSVRQDEPCALAVAEVGLGLLHAVAIRIGPEVRCGKDGRKMSRDGETHAWRRGIQVDEGR